MKKLMIYLVALLALLSLVHADSAVEDGLIETLLNQDPDPAQAGEFVELRFKVEKEGNAEFKDVRYELELEHPFSLAQSDTGVRRLGDITATQDDEHYTLFYKLFVAEDAIEDTYELSLRQTSSNRAISRVIDFDVRVGENEEVELLVGEVSTEPRKLIADFDEATLSVELVNLGNRDAEQVIVELELPEGFESSFGYATRDNLGTIESGSSKTAQFTLDTLEKIRKGAYPTSLLLTYKEEDDDENRVFTEELDFNIEVFGRPQYNIQNVSVSELQAGGSGEIRLNFKNTGSLKSDTTSVQVFKDSSQPFEFADKSVFIGSLDIGEKGEAVYLLDVKADALAQEYRFKLQFRSVVDNDILIEEKTISVTVNPLEKSSPLSSPLVLFLVGIAVLAGVGYFGYKQGKKSYKK